MTDTKGAIWEKSTFFNFFSQEAVLAAQVSAKFLHIVTGERIRF